MKGNQECKRAIDLLIKDLEDENNSLRHHWFSIRDRLKEIRKSMH